MNKSDEKTCVLVVVVVVIVFEMEYMEGNSNCETEMTKQFSILPQTAFIILSW